MGIVQRFERRLQGVVGDAFARVFGGGVVPPEIEAALQREAADRVQHLEGGHLLAPNRYVISISKSDHDALAADRDLTMKAFARHLEDFIRDQGWQTYGDIYVEFEPSPMLHTGQFRASGSVDPDVGRRGAAPPRRPDPRITHASTPVSPNPGAGPMTQNSGYDPSRDPADNPQPDQQRVRNGNAHANQHQHPVRGQGPQSGSGYPQGDQHGAPGGGYPNEYGQPGYGSYEGGYQDPGYEQGGYEHGGYQNAGYPQDQGYAQGYQPDYRGGYTHDYPAHDQHQPYPGQYQDVGYQGGTYEQPGYEQPGYGQPGYPQGGYEQGYGQETHAYTVTLQLEDGSGRQYQLREGNNIVGRGQDAQFRLPDTGVSRRHIDIRWDGRVAMLSDLGSTNGTTVNGAPVQDWQLADGDLIRAGHSDILVRIL